MVVLMRYATGLAIALALLFRGPDAGSQTQRRVVRVSAERFAFTPSQIVVDAGEEIEMRVSSDDTAHGFHISGTSVNVVIPKRGRGEVSVTFRAPDPGRYVFECTRMCGAGHHFMRGELLVRNPSAKQSRK
jgi:heme/copper-type cytochrome/quinol oxidase subunit 2